LWLEVRKICKYLSQHCWIDLLSLRSFTVFHGHHRPIHHPLFVRRSSTHVLPNPYLYPSCLLMYKRRNEEPSRIPNLIAFSILFVLSLVGAIGLTARAASRNGKGLCEDFSSAHPPMCKKAAASMSLTWIAVMFGAPSASWAFCLVGLTIH
jgi:hypothetical protein